METETKETIPLWLAVAITVVVSLPFGLYLTKWSGGLNLYNLPLWVAFIVWAEYFALGAKPSALKTLIPSFILGVALTSLTMAANKYLTDAMPGDWTEGANLSLAISLFVGVGAMVYIMRFWSVLQAGSLPFFNGISVLLGVYFTNSIPAGTDPYIAPWMAGVVAIAAGMLGAALGWFNIAITFPHNVATTQRPAPTNLAAQH